MADSMEHKPFGLALRVCPDASVAPDRKCRRLATAADSAAPRPRAPGPHLSARPHLRAHRAGHQPRGPGAHVQRLR
eukprot:15442106-Alexandrium_andersonii.AAC.1